MGPVESKKARVLRHKLPEERRSITHKFVSPAMRATFIAGMYEDGQPGEIFITMSKEGSTISGLIDSFATAISIVATSTACPSEFWSISLATCVLSPPGPPRIRISIAESIMDLYFFR